MQVAEGLSERRLRRDEAALSIDPGAELVGDGLREGLPARASLRGVVALVARCALDGEEARDDADALEGDGVSGARGFDKPSASVGPAPGALSSGALEEACGARAVALHGAGEVGAEEVANALGVTAGRVDEGHPPRVGPAPHGAVSDALGCTGIEDGQPRGVGAEQSGATRLLLDRVCDGGKQVDGSGDGAAERLRRDGHTGPLEACALPLDGLVLDVLVAEGLDDERVGELAPLDDLRRRRSRDDRVVLRARDGLVESLLDDDARGDHVESQATRMTDRGHLRAASRTAPQVRRHGVFDRDARQVCGRSVAPRGRPSRALLRLVVLALGGFGRCRHDERDARQHQLPPEALERLRRRPSTAQMSDLPNELGVEVAHATDERDDGRDQFDEAQRGDHRLEPRPHLVEVRGEGAGDVIAFRHGRSVATAATAP
jgi:hypothetical protein